VAGVTAPRFVGPDGTTALAMVDTADCYCWWNAPGDPGGHSEALLGRWLAEASTRDAVYLSTKGSGRLRGLEGVWNDDGSANWDVARSRFVGASAATLEESLAGSLDRLAIDRVDLYYVHVDDHRTPLEESLATLNGFVGDGRVGAYGWSNVRTWRLAQIRELCHAHGWPQPIALQQRHSYLRMRAGLDQPSTVDAEQLSYLRAYPDLQLVAYSPILNGINDSADKRAAHPLMADYAGPDTSVRLAGLERIATDNGCTPNQAVLAWMLAATDPMTSRSTHCGTTSASGCWRRVGRRATSGATAPMTSPGSRCCAACG
jgi:aryl-alcohol dehydrogenase-like predicted oxidoreductase